jgi:hypothetical protein
MSDEDLDKEFRRMADSFIDLANEHVNADDREIVSMALLYAAARFNAFVVASHAPDLSKYDADRDQAFEFFLGKYKEMLNENLDDYRKIYDESMKYVHLMKKQ